MENKFVLIQRLILCGFTVESAETLCDRCIMRNDWAALEAFVKLNEALYDDRKQYPKEDR